MFFFSIPFRAYFFRIKNQRINLEYNSLIRHRDFHSVLIGPVFYGLGLGRGAQLQPLDSLHIYGQIPFGLSYLHFSNEFSYKIGVGNFHLQDCHFLWV